MIPVAASAGDAVRAPATTSLIERFGGGNGATPQSALVLGASGALYGTAADGGRFSSGLVFELAPPAPGRPRWTERHLYDFCLSSGCVGGSARLAGLTPDGTGGFFGTTSAGGAHGWGAVFRLSRPPAGAAPWSLAVLYNFCSETSCGDGSAPTASLVRDPHDILYGTTFSGGAHGYGTVFSLAPPAKGQTGWRYAVIHDFDFHDGAGPFGNLVIGGGGELFGTVSAAGANGHGTAFALAPPTAAGGAWSFRVLYQFCQKERCEDGADPYSGLLLSEGGILYGTTENGGTDGWGTVFALVPPRYDTPQVVHDFVFSDGAAPVGGLVEDRADGALYGTASLDGRLGYGTLFELAPAAGRRWTETVLHDFDGVDGDQPVATLVLGKGGEVYGTTEFGGGVNNDGVVFEVAR